MSWNNALIIGSSGGIGTALSQALRARGVAVTGLSRSADGLDVSEPGSVEQVLGTLEGPFDLILIATGALEIDGAAPEKSLKQLTARAMMDQFALNALGPALVLRHAARLLPKDRPAHIAALSARVGSIGDNRLGGWYSYRAAKAALNQIMRTASIELARSHKHLACVALHPGTVQTGFTEKYTARHPSVSPREAAENLLRVLESVSAQQTGGFFDWSGAQVRW